MGLKPRLQSGTPAARGQHDDSLANLAEGDGAEEKGGGGLGAEPLGHAGIRPIPAKFGGDVCIEKVTIHRSTGRPVDGLREKSRLRPRNGAKSSTMSMA